MGQMGGFLLLMGLGSFIINLIGLQFKLLMWIDIWGGFIGFLIRLGLIILGISLIVLQAKFSKAESQ